MFFPMCFHVRFMFVCAFFLFCYFQITVLVETARAIR